MEFQMSADWLFHYILGAEMALHFSKTKAMSLSERRNFRYKFVFEEGTSPTSPTSKRRRTDEEEENERKDEEPEQLAEKVEVEGEEEASQADDEDSDDEDLNSLTFLWWDVREKFLQYTPKSVLKLTSMKELHDVLRWYFPSSQPRTSQEFEYLPLVRKAAQKRLLQLHCPCSSCEEEFQKVPSDKIVKFLQ